MAKIRASKSGGGGTQDWISADSYPSKEVVFKWNYSANAVIIAATLLSGGSGSKSFFYVDLSNPHYLKKGNFATNICNNTLDSTWGLNISYDSANNTLSISHSSYNWSDGYILPLKDSTVLS